MITNVAIRTRNPEMIDFFYPNYTRLSEFSPFITGGVIFSGDSKYLQRFRDLNIPYVYTKGTPEFDLTIPEVLINFVYQKWNKVPTKKVLEYVQSLNVDNDNDANELDNISKIIWVTGKCWLDEESDERLSHLYKSLSRLSSFNLIKEYLDVSSHLNPEKLFYSIQSFLLKSNNPDIVQNNKVKSDLKAFNEIRGKKLKSALMRYLYSPIENNELKVLLLLDELTTIEFWT